MTVQGREFTFLVDSGAHYSTLSHHLPASMISSDTVELVGFSGRPTRLPITVPLHTQLAGQTLLHPFATSSDCPINLLGRDLLVRTGAAIFCGPEGINVKFPNGSELNCSNSKPGDMRRMLMNTNTAPGEESWANIYWGELEPESSPSSGMVSLFQSWKPWLSMLRPFAPPCHLIL